jgi:hypothetical protein
VKGFYKGLVAEGTVSANDVVKMGAGAALNCVLVTDLGSPAAGESLKGRATALMGAGSEGTTYVYLW